MAKITFMKYISWSERRSIQQSMMREGRGEGRGGGRGGYPGGQTLSQLVAYHDLILLDDNLFIA